MDSTTSKDGAGLANITNQLHTAQPPLGKKAASVTFASNVVYEGSKIEKENPNSVLTHASKNGEQLEPAATPTCARRHHVLPGPQREKIEEQIGFLQDKLQSISRTNRRTSLTGIISEGNAASKGAALSSVAPLGQQSSRAKLSALGKQDVMLSAAKPPRGPPATVSKGASSSSSSDQEIGGLAAKLESLKRSDAVRISTAAGGQQAPALVERKGDFDIHALSKFAQILFEDEEYVNLCTKGMNAQLTRSKDGGNDTTKIKELAEIVKLLRRGMRETQNRTKGFVEQIIKFEKDISKHVESVRLSGESAAMAAQAELAHARREAASAAANHKSALAQWQGELDIYRSEAAALRRDIERVESDKEKAKEDVRRLEAAKAAVELELSDIRKVLLDREREAQVDRNSVAQALFETKEAAEKQQKEMSSELERAREKIEKDEADISNLRKTLTSVQDIASKLEDELKDTKLHITELETEKSNLQIELDRTRKELTKQNEMNQKACGDAAAAAKEIIEWKDKASQLLQELEKERSNARKEQDIARSAAEKAENEITRLRQAVEETSAKLSGTSDREEKLLQEKTELKAALSAAIEQHKQSQEKASALEEKCSSLEEQSNDLSTANESLQKELEKLREEASTAASKIAAAHEEASKANAVALEKSSRLSQLEGELEALQECTMGLQGGDQKELLQRMISKIASLESAVAAAEARRRDAHNQLVELKGNIRVFCRLRPHPRAIAAVAPDGVSVRLAADGKEHIFTFDRAFKPEVTQAQVFDEVSDVVQSALDGYKVCLFSYGQTGAGKTHTMQGNNSNPGEEGIIPRAISKIISTVSRLEEQGWEYSLEASYIEVYNEQLRDLLADTSGSVNRREAGKITESNPIQHAPSGGHTTVLGATRVPIQSEFDAADIVRQAACARAVESTAMNAVSSRSHAVFMLYITGRHEATETVLQGSLNLVDLAGSERLARSGAEGARAKEACSINKSLSALGDVFASLSSKSTHIPYRNSKLTHLLQPCLGGSGKTLMFVNINPEPESANESLCSLRFAAKVNACETAAKGGALRNVSSLGEGPSRTFSENCGTSVGFNSRRQSMAPQTSLAASRRKSIAPTGFGTANTKNSNSTSGSRRMSMIPTATHSGNKRSAMGPPPPVSYGSAIRNVRPKFAQ